MLGDYTTLSFPEMCSEQQWSVKVTGTQVNAHICCLALDHDCHLWIDIKVMFDAQTWPQNWVKVTVSQNRLFGDYFWELLKHTRSQQQNLAQACELKMSSKEYVMMFLVWHTNNTMRTLHIGSKCQRQTTVVYCTHLKSSFKC